MSIVNNIIDAFSGTFSTADAYEVNPDVNRESVRARIYENLGITFEKVGRGIYSTVDKSCLLIEGNGLNLSCLLDESVDAIVTDHLGKTQRLILVDPVILQIMTLLNTARKTSTKRLEY